MEEEIWKEVKGYEGIYEVSRLGRVKSLSRVVYKNGYAHRTTKERILKNMLDGHGYPFVTLCSKGSIKEVAVHSLVACAFLGHTPDGSKIVVDHINGIKTDPRAENLRIVTQRFNLTLGVRKNKGRTSSIYPGVCWHKNCHKWISNITINGRLKHLGLFSEETDAADAYQKELSKIQLQGKSRTGLPPDNWRCCILSVLDKS